MFRTSNTSILQIRLVDAQNPNVTALQRHLQKEESDETAVRFESALMEDAVVFLAETLRSSSKLTGVQLSCDDANTGKQGHTMFNLMKTVGVAIRNIRLYRQVLFSGKPFRSDRTGAVRQEGQKKRFHSGHLRTHGERNEGRGEVEFIPRLVRQEDRTTRFASEQNFYRDDLHGNSSGLPRKSPT